MHKFKRIFQKTNAGIDLARLQGKRERTESHGKFLQAQPESDVLYFRPRTKGQKFKVTPNHV